MSELENMTLLELRNFAKEQNIRNISKLKKEELIELLKQVAETSKPQEKPTEEKTEIRYDKNDEEQLGVWDGYIDDIVEQIRDYVLDKQKKLML